MRESRISIALRPLHTGTLTSQLTPRAYPSSNRIQSLSIRSTGSIPLNMCLVAQGYADAYCEFSCHPWDIAAAIPIVKEAGGVVMDPSIKPLDLKSRRMLCASTPELALELSNLLQACPNCADKNADSTPVRRLNTLSEELKKKKPMRSDMISNTRLNEPSHWWKQRRSEIRDFYRYRGVPKHNYTLRPSSGDGLPSDPSLPGQGI